MSLLWVSGFVSIFGGFLLGMFFGSGSGPGLFGLGAGREVGLFFPWKKQLAARRHLFSGGKNNPTPRPANYQGIVGERQQQKNEERKKQSINSRYAFSGVNRAWGGARVFSLKKMSERSELFFREKTLDRKSTRLNSSHVKISYAVFCLKKKKK